jgi:anti-sigma factor ChrR (cupin superfamily)
VNPRALQLLLSATPDLAGLTFSPFRDGIGKATLYADPESGAEAAVLRYEPGAQVPVHRHVGTEYILVLEGSQEDERGVYRAGTLLVNPPGSRHAVRSPEGCIVLAIWTKPVVFE